MQLRDAAEMLGVHYQAAYAWVRQGVLPDRKTGRGYDVSEGDVSALAARRASGTAPRPHIRVRDWAAQADRLHAAIMSGDETMARHVFARLARGVPLTDLCERIIAPALQRVGDDWASGAVSIGAEHRASAICERLIAARTHQPQGRPRGRLMLVRVLWWLPACGWLRVAGFVWLASCDGRAHPAGFPMITKHFCPGRLKILRDHGRRSVSTLISMTAKGLLLHAVANP